MKAIRIENLTKKFKDVTAVDGISLDIEEGELFSLLGVNGAGKTTTIKMLAGLTKPTSGDAFVEGHSIVSDISDVKSIIGLSPQETAIAPNLTVRENLELMCGIYKFTKQKTADKIAYLEEEFHLHDIMKKKASKLSGGWQRRLSIAMALVGEPKVLFLDEPTLGLDVLARSELWDTILSLKGKITTILTTHYMEEAEALSDHIAVMYSGHIIEKGTVEELEKLTNTTKLEDAFIAIVKEARL